MDSSLFEFLLSQPERTILDFKETPYQFDRDKDGEDAKLVKDIISFANTIRAENAYIISGVRDDNGNNVRLGINHFTDDATLQEKVKDKINPKPVFSSYIFTHQGLKFGIIEIPVYAYEHPLRVTVKIKGCEPGKTYFRRGTSNSEADSSEIISIDNWLKSLLIKPVPLPAKWSYNSQKVYLQRSVTATDRDTFSMLFHDNKPLIEVIKTHKRIALLAWGLSGKSTELQQLAYDLSTKSDFHVFLITLGNHSDESITSRIPEIDRIPQKQIVVLLDGLDEIPAMHFETAKRKISQFVELYPDITIAVSCRTNFYTTVADEPSLSTLANFESYQLDNLDDKGIHRYLDSFDPANKEAFLKAIWSKGLQELLSVPYYLIKLSHQFKDTYQIADSKAAIFDEEVKRLIRKEALRNYVGDYEIHERHLLNLLKRLAFIMEAMGTNQIGTVELNTVFPNQTDFDTVKNAGAIFQGTDSEQKIYKFNHNNTQEFLAAQVLSEIPFKGIQKIIGMESDFKRVKPSWVNTISFLNSILPDNHFLKKEIAGWLVKNNRELVVKLDPEKVDPKVREGTFKSIFIEHKKINRTINRTIYRSEDLAKFSESTPIFDYLLEELKVNVNINSTSNALDIINHYPLSKYPVYQPLFKKYYESFLFGPTTAYHYLALVGYTTNFILTAVEFNNVFEKFRDYEDTWIRYQLFHAIWLTGNSEQYVNYVLAQAKLLMSEDVLLSNNRRDKNRLSNEHMEIGKCLEQLKSEQALTSLFTELDLHSISRSSYFNKALKSIFINATAYDKATNLADQIRKVFLVDHGYILQKVNLKEAFLTYFQQTVQIDEILRLLYQSSIKINDLVWHSIAMLATPTFIDFLKEESSLGKVIKKDIDTFSTYLRVTKNENELYFNTVFEVPEEIIFQVRDFEKERNLNNQRNLKALFDKDLYKQEVELIFNAFGKDTISYENTHSFPVPDYWGDEFCDVARNVLHMHPDDPDLVRSKVLDRIDAYYESGFVQRIYNYLLKNQESELTEPQREVIISYCNNLAQAVDFKNAITYQDDNTSLINTNATVLSFFMRKLNLTHYKETVYLDMLSFVKHDDSLIDIFEYVVGIVGYSKVHSRALVNLKERIANYTALSNHVTFIKDNQVKEAVNLLIPYINQDEPGNSHEILKVFLDLGGDINLLKGILARSTSYFRNSLIEEFIKTGNSYIQIYLEERFTTEADELEKLQIAKYLVKLQNKAGLIYYINYIKRNNLVPDDSSPVNPLYSLNKVKFVNQILNLFELAQNPILHSDTFSDLRSISATCLQNIALYNSNYPIVKKKINWWIKRKKIRSLFSRSKSLTNLFANLYFYLDSMKQQYYVEQAKMLSLGEAIILFDKISLRRPL